MSFDTAKRKIMVADHMLSMTYKQLKDPKILLGVLDNVHQALSSGLSELLLKEREYKRVPAYNETPEGMFNVFRDKLAVKMGAKPEAVRNMGQLLELQKEHKNAPVEFARNKTFVIANKDYRLKMLTEEKLKNHIKFTKELLQLFERYANVRGY